MGTHELSWWVYISDADAISAPIATLFHLHNKERHNKIVDPANIASPLRYLSATIQYMQVWSAQHIIDKAERVGKWTRKRSTIGLCLALSRYIAHAADLHIKPCTRYINSTE